MTDNYLKGVEHYLTNVYKEEKRRYKWTDVEFENIVFLIKVKKYSHKMIYEMYGMRKDIQESIVRSAEMFNKEI